jgi:plasmid maintenance system killer protein
MFQDRGCSGVLWSATTKTFSLLAELTAAINRASSTLMPFNDQWRICFEWPDGSAGPVAVEIVDYH